ncbi:hypothetical protein ACHQM5_015401 [Ranunculus cassubicifolius]
MGAMFVMKITLLLLFSSSLLSFSSAGRSNFIDTPSLLEMSATQQETTSLYLRHSGGSDVHERILRYNTKDYGTYDPSPTLNKPPFKLIPN